MSESSQSVLRNWLVFGEPVAPASLLSLRAGPLQLFYEPASGFIRRVRLGHREVIRGIYAAVRDRHWATIPAALTETCRSVSADSFHIEFDAVHRQGDIHFAWHGAISGQRDGSLRYTFDGRAESRFFRNRIGLCVLHPIRECAGAKARQTRTDGTVMEGRFPEGIEPQLVGQSPFRDLKELAHEVAPGVWAELQFAGDVFELEDQRNWTDASFKTYSTPLERPFPVEIGAGTPVQQSVLLRLTGSIPGPEQQLEAEPETGRVVEVALRAIGPRHPLNIGLGLADHGHGLTDKEAGLLRALRLSHLRVDIRLADPEWPAAWQRALREAEQLGARLELALHLPPDGRASAAELRDVFCARPDLILRVLALREGEAATGRETLAVIRQIFADSSLPVGAGTDANFCELNREQALGRVPVAEADFLFWPMNPQVHATDSRSILETLQGQPDSLRTAGAFAPGKPLVISPVTLKPRSKAVPAAAAASSAARPGPAAIDSRQLSLFAAAWTLGSLAALSAAGASSVTLFETTGSRGVIEREAGSAWPADIPAFPGQVFPVYHLLAQLAGYGSFQTCPPGSDLAYAAAKLPDRDGRTRVLLTNLTSQPQRFNLTGAPFVHLHVLDEQSVAAAMANPGLWSSRPAVRLAQKRHVIELELSAYALAFITL